MVMMFMIKTLIVIMIVMTRVMGGGARKAAFHVTAGDIGRDIPHYWDETSRITRSTWRANNPDDDDIDAEDDDDDGDDYYDEDDEDDDDETSEI